MTAENAGREALVADLQMAYFDADGNYLGEAVLTRDLPRITAVAVAEAAADALREAADGLYLSRPGQHNEGAKDWLHRRANLIDPRTRGSVCEHGNRLSSDCGYCATDRLFRPDESAD